MDAAETNRKSLLGPTLMGFVIVAIAGVATYAIVTMAANQVHFPKQQVHQAHVLGKTRTLHFALQSVYRDTVGWHATYSGPTFTTATGSYKCYYTVDHGSRDLQAVWGTKNGKRTIVRLKWVARPNERSHGGFCAYGDVTNMATLHDLVTIS